jgi:hypothetical protein
VVRRIFPLAAILALLSSGCVALEVKEQGGTGTTPEMTVAQPAPSEKRPESTTSTFAPSFPGRLTLTITTPEGDRLGGVLVELGDKSFVTDGSGSFFLESVSGGDVLLSKPGWWPITFDWTGEDSSNVVQLDRRIIRGLHISGDAAGDDQKFAGLLELALDTAVNAFVFDTKQEGGVVLYDTAVSEAHEMGAVNAKYDPGARVAQAHYAGLYTITRIVTFEDRNRANARPGEKLAGPWIDPRSEAAWAYNIALATEACSLGFDEIQFDYVRFPSGDTASVSGQFDLTQAERVGAISGFLGKARESLEPMGCSVSAAIFGIVLATENDQGIGQRPEELSSRLDAISPMVYPSHYADGWIGYPEPNDHPYDVTSNAIDDGLRRIDSGSALRPWLQAFWWTQPDSFIHPGSRRQGSRMDDVEHPQQLRP